MNIFDNIETTLKQEIKTPVQEVAEDINKNTNEVVETTAEAKLEPISATVETSVEQPEVKTEVVSEEKLPEIVLKRFKIKYGNKKYKVVATSKEEAEQKIAKFFNEQQTEEKIEGNTEEIILTVKDIFNAIAEEITRIVTVAHPETVDNTYDRWIAVLTEELGEITHEINDEFEGKVPTKNTFVECVQLCAATILLAKKFAKEHPEIFKE